MPHSACGTAVHRCHESHRAAIRAAEAGDERRSSRWPDLRVSVKGGEQWREGRRIGVLEVERLQDEPTWCGSGGVFGVAPADQEGHQAAGYRRVDVMAGNRPAGQPTTADAVGAKRARRPWLGLPGIGSDDLQIGLRAESEQRVVGAQAGVLATGLGPDTQTLLHLSNCAGQVRSPVDEMVDQHHPIILRARSSMRVRLSLAFPLPRGHVNLVAD